VHHPNVVDGRQVRLLPEADVLLRMYRTMLLSRTLDIRMFALNRQGRVPFVVPCQGHEGAQVGMVSALRPGRDFFLLYYRDLATALAIGVTARDIMLGVFARADDPASAGRQMPEHFSDRRLRIFTGSSSVGTQIPHASGMALASKLRGEDDLSVASFGEGATSKGDFHEGVNFAAVQRLPVIFFCQNNGYTISEPVERQMVVKSVAERASGYGIPGLSVDGNDAVAVWRAVSEAAARARAGDGPTLIEARTYRLAPHTSDDDDRAYRSRVEVEEWRRRDPIDRLKRFLEEERLLDAAADEQLHQEVAMVVDDATEFAAAATAPDPATLLRHVYAGHVDAEEPDARPDLS
jgi:2-oxoisovalerate dehydrogenase E1 component alpha subunit